MGNWNIVGIVVVVGVFFTLFGFLMSQINVANPYTGMESSILSIILDWITPF